MASSIQREANRLAHEKSPYLLQHAYNPVKWYPWGKEAFDRAKAENKMIFLSIGYSTCHWCHVMERESFESDEIGRVMNEHYISVKVDREERPDVDRVYMTFVQATTGGGGWPLSIWLTPDRKPVVGGTYFPPNDRYYGRPGFKTILLDIAEKWREHRDKVEGQGTAVLDALLKFSNVRLESGESVPGKDAVLTKCYSLLKKSYDPAYGGFSKAPKFPQPVNFSFLLRYYEHQKDANGQEALQMVKHSLTKMALGGIYDHVSKGFHRYSTDHRWHVPHFEKMLYDQAQLSAVFAETYQITKDDFYEGIARDILEYVNRDLSHADGGFFCAEDADSLPTPQSTEKKEGAFCVWTYDEVMKTLSEPIEGTDKTLGDLFCRHYGVKKNGNVDPLQDPHDELKNQNVLIIEGGLSDTAEYFGLDPEKAKSLLAQCRQRLYDVRLTRPKPSLDDKILTAWNGLMISGFAKCGQAFHDQTYIDRAIKAANFIRDHMYDKSPGVLLRSSYTSKDGEISQISQPINAFVDDYAFLIRGLIDLYEACFDESWLEMAERLQNTQDRLFWDEENAGYFNTSTDDPTIVLRLKDDQDGAEPSSNSVSCHNLLRLGDYLDSEMYRNKATSLLRLFSDNLQSVPVAFPELVSSLLFNDSSRKQIIILGDRKDPETKKLIDSVHAQFLPNKILIVADPAEKGFLHGKLQILNNLELKDGKPTAFVCKNFSCQLPVNVHSQLKSLLEK